MRRPRPLDDDELQRRVFEMSQRLADTGTQRLMHEELIAATLYTGPCFVKYNAVRQTQDSSPHLPRGCWSADSTLGVSLQVLRALTSVPFLVDQYTSLCHGNRLRHSIRPRDALSR